MSSWTGITKNKIITDTDLNNAVEAGYLSKKSQQITIPRSDLALTKSRLVDYADVDSINTTLSNKTNNQLITKQDIRKPCGECTSYDIVITQGDIDISGDGKVYFYYYPCGLSTQQYLTFSNPGTYQNYICTENCTMPEPTICIQYDGGCTSPLNNSRFVEIAGNCQTLSNTYRTVSCGTTEYIFTISNAGYTYINTKFDLGQTYGNVPITLSYTSYNSLNEVFIGNLDEKIGDTYSSAATIVYKEEVVGFVSSKQKTTMDVVVYSTGTDGIFIPYDITVKIGCPTTLNCGTNLINKTYVTNVNINVTDTGYIKYDTNTNTVYKYVSSTGLHAIPDCIILESLSSDTPYADDAAFTILYSGNTCNAGTDDCLEITFISNSESETTIGWTSCVGAWRTRILTAGETFTTCAIKNSGYGQNTSISQGIGCSGTITPADIYYNDANSQYYLSAWFSNVKDNNHMCLGYPTSFYYVPGNGLLSTPTYIFQDAAGTIPFNFNYFVYAAIPGVGSIGYEYNKITGEVGLQTYICL
jgi:hypothetical protein